MAQEPEVVPPICQNEPYPGTHDFSGPMVYHKEPNGSSWGSVTCIHCGMKAIEYDSLYGP